jgi:hypothetical protein
MKSEKKLKQIISFAVIFILVCLMPKNGDDFCSIEIPFFEGIELFWNYCNPRWPNFFVPLIRFTGVFELILSGLIFYLLILLEKITKNEQAIFLMPLLILPAMWSDAVLNKTASFNYLIPLIFLMQSYLFLSENRKNWHYLFFMLTSASTEWAAAGLIVFAFFKKDYKTILIALAGFIFIMLAPGSLNRAAKVGVHWTEVFKAAPEKFLSGLKLFIPAIFYGLYERSKIKWDLLLAGIGIYTMLCFTPVKDMLAHRWTLIPILLFVISLIGKNKIKVLPILAGLVVIVWSYALFQFRSAPTTPKNYLHKIFVGVEKNKFDYEHFKLKYKE